MSRYLFLTLILSIVGASTIALAATTKSVTVTSWDPAPYGRYDALSTNTLKLNNQTSKQDGSSYCNANTQNIVYIDSVTGDVRVCPIVGSSSVTNFWVYNDLGATPKMVAGFPAEIPTITGNTAINGNTTITGAASISGALTTGGDITIGSSKNIILDGGNIVVKTLGATKNYYYDFDLTGNIGSAIGAKAAKKIALFSDTDGNNFYGFGLSSRVQGSTDNNIEIHLGSSGSGNPGIVMQKNPTLPGNIGIGVGITTPTATLDVNGSQHVAGISQLNGVVTVGTATGNMTTITGGNIASDGTMIAKGVVIPTKPSGSSVPCAGTNGCIWLE